MSYESNSFASGLCTVEDFEKYEFGEGVDVFTAGNGEITGALEAAARAGFELIPTTSAVAGSGPTVSSQAYAALRKRFLDGLATLRGQVDGVYLHFHGAMTTEDEDDVEGDLSCAVREMFGPNIPIVISCDLHGHFTDQMARATDLIVAYHTCPHVDYRSTGQRAMELLGAAMSSAEQPVLRYRKVRMMASAEAHDTSSGPMKEVMDQLHAIASEPGVLDASVFLTQPWLDVAELGWATVVVTDGDSVLAQDYADKLAVLLWDRRERVLFRKTPIEKALQQVRDSATDESPFVLSDGGDSCSAGSGGDSAALLSHLLAIPVAGESVLAITDALAAARCHGAALGEWITVDVGGRLTPKFFPPVRIAGVVTTLTDGRYPSNYPLTDADVGPTAVIRTATGINLIITSRPANQLDLALFDHVGIDPRAVKVVQVKSAGGYREYFAPIAFCCIDLATPGPADSRLPMLPFTRPRRPLWPFDKDIGRPFVELETR